MRRLAIGGLLVSVLIVGCGSNSITGTYRIQQEGTGFGNGMDQVHMELREDKSYTITAGEAQWFVGTWSVKDDILEISSSNANIGTTFRVWKGQLFPFANGKEVPGWSWVK